MTLKVTTATETL